MPIDPQRLAVCSWSLQPADPDDLIARVHQAGISSVQLALTPLVDGSPGWADAPAKLKEAGITVVSGMLAPTGEDYTSLDTIRQTGGIVPNATWEMNQRLITETSLKAAEMGLGVVSFHAGFIPEDPAEPGYGVLVDRLRWAAGVYGDRGVDLLLETGQERAEGLNAFLDAVQADGRAPNIGVNFDPANMILYGMGDPISALRALMPRVKQVHIKDAKATANPGTWGSEVAVGKGDVNWPGFLGVLEEAGYRGPLVIEREAGEDRVGDIARAVALLTK